MCVCVSRTTWKPIQQRQSTEGKPGCKTSSMKSLVTYTVEWRVLKSSSRVARRRRRRRLDNASSWFAGGVTGRRGCRYTRRLLIQSTHARLLLLLHDNHKLTLYSPHCCRHLASNIDYTEDLGHSDIWTCPCINCPVSLIITGMWLGS